MAVNVASNATTALSTNQIMQDFAHVQQPQALIGVTLQRRRLGDAVGFNDFEDVDLPFAWNMNFNKAKYFGFEKIIVRYILVQPYTDVIIQHENRLMKSTHIHNGTGTVQKIKYYLIKPWAFSIVVQQAYQDGIYNVKDCKFFDMRCWVFGAIIGIVAMIIIIAIASAFSKESFGSRCKSCQRILNADREEFGIPDDLNYYSKIRMKGSQQTPTDWNELV